jgi:AcrR family transcriptional regulator
MNGTAPSATRQQLSRARIVDEAVALLDNEGTKALSMRRLAAQLGCGTMSIYHHVPDKAALGEAIAERLMDDLARPATDEAWDDAIRTMAGSFRQLTRQHPDAFQLLLSGPRPAALVRIADDVVERLISAGFSEAAAQTAFRSLIRYLLGTVLVEHDARAETADLDKVFGDGLDLMLAGIAASR